MMTSNPELVIFAEEHRVKLPTGFFHYLDDVDASLRQNNDPAQLSAKGEEDEWYSQIGPQILAELKSFLCSDDERYSDLRREGGELTKSSVLGIALFLAGKLGLSAGLLCGAVAFMAVVVIRIGKHAFCNVVAKSK